MRAFLAVNLHTGLQKELAGIQDRLRAKIHGVRWVAPQLLHITLKFLGEQDEDLLSVLEKPLQKLGDHTAPFVVSLDRLGAFPSPNNPRVFWIGVGAGASQLRKLAAGIEECLKNLPPSSRGRENTGKPFQPHLTLGRKKNKGRQGGMSREILEKTSLGKNVLHVNSFYLMQSVLYSTGPVYTPLREFLLQQQE